MITKKMLRTDKPVEKRLADGRINSVLALWKESIWGEDNHYLGRWIVSNVAYYNANIDHFEGWIELEDMLLPEHLCKVTTKQGD